MPLARAVKRGKKQRGAKKATERAPKVNDAVEIWWPDDKTFYRGILAKNNGGENEFLVVYDDGETENVILTKEFWRYSDIQPTDNVPKKEEEGDVSEEVLDWSDGPKEEEDKSKAKGKKEKAKEQGVSASRPGAHLEVRSKNQADGGKSDLTTTGEKPPVSGFANTNLPRGAVGSGYVSISAPGIVHVAPADAAPVNRGEITRGSEAALNKTTGASNSATNVVAPSKEKQKVKAGADASKEKADKPKGKLSRKKSVSESNAASGTDGAAVVSKVVPKANLAGENIGAVETKEEPVLDVRNTVGHSRTSGLSSAGGDSEIVMSTTRVESMVPSVSEANIIDVNDDDDSDDDVPLASTREAAEAAQRKAGAASAGKGKDITQIARAMSMPVASGMVLKSQSKRVRGKPRKSRKEESTGAQKQPLQPPKKTPVQATTPKVAQKVPAVPVVAPRPGPTGQIMPSERKQLPPKDVAPTAKGMVAEFAADEMHVKAAEGLAKTVTVTDVAGTRAAKEDSTRSKSSSEKPIASFAAKRIKKRKPLLPVSSEPAPAAPFVVAPKVVSVKTTEVTTMSKLSHALEEGVNGAGNRSLKLKLRGEQVGDSPSVSKAGTALDNGIANGKGESGALRGSGRTTEGLEDTPTSGDAMDVVKSTSDEENRASTVYAPSNSRKRPRVEDVAPGREIVSAMQIGQARGDAEVSPEGSGVTEMQLASGLNRLKHQMSAMMDERLSHLRAQNETFGDDIRRLMSILLSFKQELEVYKDFVRRTVAEEARNSRGAMTELRMDVLSHIELHSRQLEHKMDSNMRNLSSNLGMVGANGGVPGRGGMIAQVGSAGPRRDTTTTAPGGGGPFVYEDRRPTYGNSSNRVMTDVQNTGTSRGPSVANGHNDSPTTIANPEQSGRGDAMYSYPEAGDGGKEFDEPLTEAALKTRVTHLVARQVTVWLLETPHEYNANSGSVDNWAEQTAVRTFSKVGEQLMRFTSYTQAYQTLCSSLGNDAVELQWFVSPGVQEHLHRARKNYAAWDPPPSDDEWKAEMVLLKVLGEKFGRSLDRYEPSPRGDISDMEACVSIAAMAANDRVRG